MSLRRWNSEFDGVPVARETSYRSDRHQSATIENREPGLDNRFREIDQSSVQTYPQNHYAQFRRHLNRESNAASRI